MRAASWIDKLTEPFAPRFTLRRQRARIAAEMLVRHYESASWGRRTEGWRRSSADANAAAGSSLARLRDVAHDLVRNNAYAESMVSTVVDHAVGWGIVGKSSRTASKSVREKADARWKPWAETRACDADGQHDFAGLQKLAMRTAVVSGEALIRRRWRRPEDNLPIPMQLQVLEPDFLDTAKEGPLPNGGRIIQGVEFDPIGRRSQYWMFREHPGSDVIGLGSRASVPVPASEILHVFKATRPGQVRGVTWFAPVILPLKDFDEYEDAALVKQKIAACLAVIMSDLDGPSTALGATSPEEPLIERLEPGMLLRESAGRSVTVVDPPLVSEHDAYSKTVLRKIAAGFGVTYEDTTGDYVGLPFSAARMSRLRHWARVEDWRWRMLIPQFCDPVWAWAMQAAAITGLAEIPAAEWTAPPAPMIDPPQESLAYERMVRNGQITWPEMVRERGYDPEVQAAEIAEWNTKLDRLGIILDSDPRNVTQGGQLQGEAAAAFQPEPPGPSPSTPAEPSPPTTSANGASSNGRGDTDLARAFRLLERALSRQAAPIHIDNHPAPAQPAPQVTVGSPNMTIAKGAIHAEMHAAPAPEVRIESPVTIADGAIRVDVQPAPITVDAPVVNVAPAEVHIARGAIHAEMHAPDVSVEAPVVRIEEGAVQVSSPTTITPAPVPPTVTVVRTPQRKRRRKPAVNADPGSTSPVDDDGA